MRNKFKIITTLGAAISLSMILMSVMAYVFDMNQNKYLGWINFVVIIVVIVLAQRYYRENFYGGFASYGKILGASVLMLLIASAVMFIYTFVFYKFIAPEALVKMLEMAEINMYDQELSNAAISKSVDVMEKFVFTPLALSASTLFLTFFQGLVISLISSIFIKKNADGFTEAMRDINNE